MPTKTGAGSVWTMPSFPRIAYGVGSSFLLLSTPIAATKEILKHILTMLAPPETSGTCPTDHSSNQALTEKSIKVVSVTKLVEKPRFFHNIDGGARGWASVVGAWLIQFSMLGAVLAFGSYQTFYQDLWLPVSSRSYRVRHLFYG